MRQKKVATPKNREVAMIFGKLFLSNCLQISSITYVFWLKKWEAGDFPIAQDTRVIIPKLI
jgi:hypothetical protein